LRTIATASTSVLSIETDLARRADVDGFEAAFPVDRVERLDLVELELESLLAGVVAAESDPAAAPVRPVNTQLTNRYRDSRLCTLN
jgi:hypothetical protein